MSVLATTRNRPISVTLVAVLAIVVAVYSLASGGLTLRGGQDDQFWDGIFHLGLGVVVLAAAVGAFLTLSWGWVAFMTWAVVGLSHQILRYLFFEDPNFADMAVNAFAVLALSPADVQIAFGLRHTQNVDFSRATRNPVDGD